MKGPLGSDHPEVETDVIVTAVMLGFALTRVIQGQPFSFDTEPKDFAKGEREGERLRAGVTALLKVLAAAGYTDAGQVVEAGQSAAYDACQPPGGNLITGRPGGEALQPRGRDQPMTDYYALEMGQWEAGSAGADGQSCDGQYHSYGAYTGMINDPVGHHTLIQPTLRRVIRDPRRWQPVDGVWGLIGTNNEGGEAGPNLSPAPREGMGPLRRHHGVVQYVHGMSWAMREAVRWGPWCTAYEMAVGAKTHKLASCFACTTYMWAAGFPASSSHIGRGESWGPLPDGSLGPDEDHGFSDGAEGVIERSIAGSLNARWHLQVGHQMRQGADLLDTHFLQVAGTHRPAVSALVTRTERSAPTQLMEGGKLFLDALTFHKRDVDRLCDTLRVNEPSGAA